MCYELDGFFSRARIAALLRREKEKADELKQQGKPTPVAPAEAKGPAKNEEPVTA